MKKKSNIYTFLIDSKRNEEIERSIHEAITKKAIENGMPEWCLEDYGLVRGFLEYAIKRKIDITNR